MEQPLIIMSSWPPRACGIGTFAEETVDHAIRPYLDDRPIHVISHVDGTAQNGESIDAIIDPSKDDWWHPIVQRMIELGPYAVHIQHEYGLYDEGNGTLNPGFLKIMGELKKQKIPTIVEPHTVHTRPNEKETEFLKQLLDYASIVILKEPLLRERLEWTLGSDNKDYKMPANTAVVRHGAMTGYAHKYQRNDVLDQLHLEDLKGKNIVLLIGWIQRNKRWDYVLNNWDSILNKIDKMGGNAEEWTLLAAGQLRDPASHQKAYDNYMESLRDLQERGLAKYYEFEPRGERYYQVMSLADIVALPSIDETQSGTLARIIALSKAYVTLPIEGLALQTAESQGGLLATDEVTLADRIVDLAIDPEKRQALSKNQANYLKHRVSWEVVGKLYLRCYELARDAISNEGKVIIPKGDPLFNGHF